MFQKEYVNLFLEKITIIVTSFKILMVQINVIDISPFAETKFRLNIKELKIWQP
jgi:hypothetical protein